MATDSIAQATVHTYLAQFSFDTKDEMYEHIDKMKAEGCMGDWCEEALAIEYADLLP